MLTSEFIENLLSLGYKIDFYKFDAEYGEFIIITLWDNHERYRRLAMSLEQFRCDFKDIILAMIKGFKDEDETVHE